MSKIDGNSAISAGADILGGAVVGWIGGSTQKNIANINASAQKDIAAMQLSAQENMARLQANINAQLGEKNASTIKIAVIGVLALASVATIVILIKR